MGNFKEEDPGKLTVQSSTNKKEKSWGEKPHEELVKEVRAMLQHRDKLYGGHLSPEEIIRSKLHSQYGSGMRLEFFAPIAWAWDALAYDRYTPGESTEITAGSTLRYHASCSDGGPTIKLDHPLQIKIIDALTDAVGIPHKKGQAEIPIPEKPKHLQTWVNSTEYRNRVASVRKTKT